MTARLEHVNLTVSDPLAFADVLTRLFDWRIRWQGHTQSGELSVHVGADDNYIALFAPAIPDSQPSRRYTLVGGLNHVAVVVDDLNAARARVRDAGLTLREVAAYEPGQRFYFDGPDGVEFEVVSYTAQG